MTNVPVLGTYEKLNPMWGKSEVYERGYFILDSAKPLAEARLFQSGTKDELKPTAEIIKALREMPEFVQMYQGNERFLKMRVGPLIQFRGLEQGDLASLLFQLNPDELI